MYFLVTKIVEKFEGNSWEKVKYNPKGIQKYPDNRKWSKQIYEEIVKRPNTLKETSGGVNHNAAFGKLDKRYITKEDADWLCQNPCQWYNKDPYKDDLSKMCDCNSLKAVNFPKSTT